MYPYFVQVNRRVLVLWYFMRALYASHATSVLKRTLSISCAASTLPPIKNVKTKTNITVPYASSDNFVLRKIVCSHNARSKLSCIIAMRSGASSPLSNAIARRLSQFATCFFRIAMMNCAVLWFMSLSVLFVSIWPV